MSAKRTFGLVGDYGGDSSEDETTVSGEVGSPKQDEGYLVEKKKQRVAVDRTPTKATDQTNHEAETVQPQQQQQAKSKWDGVRIEYEDSSLMYKYTQV